MTNESKSKKSFQNDLLKQWLGRILNGAIVVFFFLLPWQGRYIFSLEKDGGVPFEYGTLSIFGIEVILWIIAIIGMVVFKYEKKQAGKKNIPIIIMFLFAIFAFASILWSGNNEIALQSSVRLMAGVLLLFILTFSSKNNKWIIFAIVLSGIFQAMFGIYQFLSQTSFESTILGIAMHDPGIPGTSVIETLNGRWLRAYGGLAHPNILGGFLSVVLFVVFDQVKLNSIKWGSAFILLTGLFFTFSRSAWIAGVIILVWYFILSLKKKNQYIYWLLILMHILLLVLLFKPLVLSRSTGSGNLEKRSNSERVEGIQEAWSVVKENPVIGVGIGNYTHYVKSELRMNDPLYTYQPVHNTFLLILGELGFIGLFLFLGIFYSLIKYYGFSPLYIILFVLMFFDHYLWSILFGVFLFWGILWIFLIYSKTKSSVPS